MSRKTEMPGRFFRDSGPSFFLFGPRGTGKTTWIESHYHSPWGSSTFLPQMWEDFPDGREFLGRLCEKHGAPADCWRDPSLRVETYQAVVFREKENPPRPGDWFTVDASGRYDCSPRAGRQGGAAGGDGLPLGLKPEG
jgi:hypothetical protein